MYFMQPKTLWLGTLVSTFLCTSSLVWATNGMLPIGTGVAQRAVGGAGVAESLNTMSMATNPAAAAFAADGYDVGVEVFKPQRKATFKGTAYGAPVDIEADGNGDDTFLIPEVGYKRQVAKQTTAGVAVYATGGMSTAYDNGLSFGSGYFSGATAAKTGVNFEQVIVAPTVAHQLHDKVAVGVSANVVYQRFKAEGLEAFSALSSDPTALTGKGYDSATGVGASVGVQGKITPKLNVGVAYRSKVNMSKFDKYKGLFPNGGELDVPAVATAGVAYQINPKTTALLDVEHIAYSDVDAIGNAVSTKPFGVADGPGFSWHDQTVYKMGVRHQVKPDLSVSAGYNYGKSPVKSTDTTVNTIAPGIVDKHLTLGLEKRLTPKTKLQASYIHAFDKTVKGNTSVSSLPIPLDAYDLNMSQDAVGLAYSVEF